jgi:RNA polymerase-binding transcription factor DksA
LNTQKEFSHFEEAATYARELAAKLGSSVFVQKTETGWIVRRQNPPDQISDPTNTKSLNPVKLPEKTKEPKKLLRKKSSKVHDRNISSNLEECLCVDCGGLIPPARVEAVPNVQRCTKCQSRFESRDPSIIKRTVDEGLAGSRDDHKKMRAHLWGDMMRRRRE